MPSVNVFVGKSFGELSWDSCLVRGTLDIPWYCGMVAATVTAVGCLQLLGSWTCLSACRAENSCVEALAKPDKLRVEAQRVNSLDEFCAQLLRS